ncbi:cysteine-rich CWC family protein [Paucibacter sp. APW11]|uniref:Cysteine-rich CWC family protein n=1 Tax=Roseateles aquae TaxID=3077235 RepID=A0ABU3PDI2_9BURK|nr:cysteine-rich CWC family protein [Paucibacter sp. APW11]MDT9000645.1 cysteine-rich CWC family protein [Paucibacter sp. APW11]
MSTATLLDDRCPRCGQAFHCGAQDARCDCFDLKLSEALRQQLAAQYERCLCIACLKALQQAEQAGTTAAE